VLFGPVADGESAWTGGEHAPHPGDPHSGTGSGGCLGRHAAHQRWITLGGGDMNDDTHQFVQDRRTVQVTPHVAQHTTNRASASDGRTTRHPGYTVSQQTRKRVEETIGWLKTVGLLRTVTLRGV